MAIKIYKRNSAGRRNMSVVKHDKDITTAKPERSLLGVVGKSFGRSGGKISTRHKGGGCKRRYRLVDFVCDKFDIVGRVASLEKDPNRSALISLVVYADGAKRYFFLITIIVGFSIILKPKRLIALLKFTSQLKRDTLLKKLNSEYGNSIGQFLSFGVLEPFRNIIDPAEQIRIPDVLMNCSSKHFKANKKKYSLAQVFKHDLKTILFYIKHSGAIIPYDNSELVVLLKRTDTT